MERKEDPRIKKKVVIRIQCCRGGRPTFCHINTQLQPMAPPWQESLHKLAMEVVKKIRHTIPFPPWQP